MIHSRDRRHKNASGLDLGHRSEFGERLLDYNYQSVTEVAKKLPKEQNRNNHAASGPLSRVLPQSYPQRL
jgi:hypothetical protein